VKAADVEDKNPLVEEEYFAEATNSEAAPEKRKRPRLKESWDASLEQPSPEVCSIKA
jgi:hypothetical protein